MDKTKSFVEGIGKKKDKPQTEEVKATEEEVESCPLTEEEVAEVTEIETKEKK